MSTTKRTSKASAIIPSLPEEIDFFQGEAERYAAGEIPDAEFTAFRLKQGVYGQRQADAQMVRIKIPFGGMTADMLDAMGDIAEQFAPLKKGHVTTRENIQFHHVPLDMTPELMRQLADVGLTTREACGNTVRNVAGCPRAGCCGGEAFDTTPYLAAYARYFVRHPVTQGMPRKIKSAFSGCEHDCAMTAIHDIGLVAKVREFDGAQKKGFKLVVGGGTSIMPRIAPTLYEFVPVEDYLKVVEAALRVFDRSQQERKNRMKARIKFMVDRLGIDEFRNLVEEELKQPWAQQEISPDPFLFIDDEEADAPRNPKNGYMANGYPEEGKDSPEFQRWVSTNVREQKQEGYKILSITIPQGDLTPIQFRGLAQVSRDYAGGRARITQQQGMVLRWVPEGQVRSVWQELKGLDLGDPGYDEITDVVTCPGTDSCKLGITASMGVGAILRDTLLEMKIDDPETRRVRVKASGCPNGCGQHHMAQIGFHGAAMKGASGQQVPAYEVFVGGNTDGTEGDVRIAERVSGRVPAKRAPEFLKEALAFYSEERNEGESFNNFVDRVGAKSFEPILARYKEIGALSKETIGLYMDWGKTIPYKLERGEGECAV
ncbi:nitrite/sulfite reductase [Dehalococcoidia bacterium]|nr:nitrite/sulfite reductase [Dehalococcoidia bacterium]